MRLKDCRAAVAAFDVSSVSNGEPPELKALEATVARALERTFGEDTADYRRFSRAARLSWFPAITLIPVYGSRPTTPTSEYQAHTSRNIEASLALLDGAIRSLEEELGEQEQRAQLASAATTARPMAAKSKVFLVHGHDEAELQAVARFLEKLGLETVVLRERPDQGRTIIEKFESCAAEVGFAVVLLTPDDLGGGHAGPTQGPRARQNVLFELGFFAGHLGRGRTCLMRKGDVELPSDLYGVIYTELDTAGAWKARLVGELKAANLDFDANRMWS